MTVFRLSLLFFLSGSAGLIYEVVWTRLFADILGSTAVSMVVVFSVFLVALASGAYIFGRIRVYGKKALLLYGALEIGIGVSALLISALLLFGKSWISVNIPTSDSFAGALAANILVTTLLIGGPTMLMGGTLPVILNAAHGWTSPRQVVAQLYGWNTLGAACGALAAGFFLIWKLGLIQTLSVAIGLNLLVGLMAAVLARFASPQRPGPKPRGKKGAHGVKLVGENFTWLTIAFLSGFSVLAYEILWGRLAKFLLGDRTIAISALLFIFIACLGLGSLFAPLLQRYSGADTNRKVRRAICLVFLIASFLHLISVPLARSTIGGHGLSVLLPVANEFVRRILTVWLLILPPVFTLGLVFPLIARSAARINDQPGIVMGKLYFVNTLGAAIGAAIAYFALSRWTGTLGGFLVLTVFLGTSFALLLFFTSDRAWHRVVAVIAVVGLALACLRFPVSLVELRNDEMLLLANEDEYGVQVLTRTGRQMMRVRNNRLNLIYDLGHPETSYAQQMPAHLTLLLADRCKDVLNIGTGYGITAGAFTLFPGIRSIDTIEILPFLVKHQNLFAKYNFDYLKDPRVTLIQGDGRHYLATTSKKYDIIAVNVLDPYLPGSSALYTVDFWKEARDHLRPGGVFTQLFWGKDIPLLLKGLTTVFPTVLLFPAYGRSSFNCVAFRENVTEAELSLHLDRLGPGAIKEIRKLTRMEPGGLFPELVRRAWKRRSRFTKIVSRVSEKLHTDDFPILEFRWAHGVGGVSVLDSPLVGQ